MNEILHKLLLRLKTLRPYSAQLVFFAGIFPNSVIAIRNEILDFKKKNPDIKEVDFILNSPGGLADDAYRLIRTLRKNFESVNVIIPFWAKSAATILSLGGTKIIMDEFGEFGPLDAQIAKAREDGPAYDRESALNDEHSVSILENRYKLMYEQMFIRLYEHEKINIQKTELSEQLLKNLSRFFKPLLSQINPYKLGEKKRTLDIGAQYAKRILLQFGSPKNEDSARELIDYLIHECPDHGYVIDKNVMENFVSNIHESDIFGPEYKEVLQEISMYLMKESDETNIVGFVEDEPTPSVADTPTAVINDEILQVEDENKLKSGEDFAQEVIAAAVNNDTTT
jgi:hypothetical protein